MYVLISGSVTVNRGPDGAAVHVGAPGAPIGEISFLRGWPATATVTAVEPVEVFVLDDGRLSQLELRQPRATADFMRYLAEVAEERTASNLALDTATPRYDRRHLVDVHLCRNDEMLARAQRLRYEVYCTELGRQSPFADHQKRLIADQLDATGQTFLALEGGEVTGTLRANLASDGNLGILEELYGMSRSPYHPAATAICTKFIVRKAKRGGQTSFKLIAAVVTLGLRLGVKECFIDCIPPLLPYYKAMGFAESGPVFLHRENGPSHPMRLDLQRHGARLSREAGLLAYARLIVVASVHKLLAAARSRRDDRPAGDRGTP